PFSLHYSKGYVGPGDGPVAFSDGDPITARGDPPLLQSLGSENVAVIGFHQKWRGPGHRRTAHARRAIDSSSAAHLNPTWSPAERSSASWGRVRSSKDGR
ncbi:MAG: hypothetical protein ACYCV7_10055, partial [Acidimicrobiales bacterium]